MSREFVDDNHNEAVDVETSLMEAMNRVEQLLNRLHARNPHHPLIEWLTDINYTIESVPWDQYYDAKQREVGEEAWWEER